MTSCNLHANGWIWEKTILSEVTQTWKDKYNLYWVILAILCQYMSSQSLYIQLIQ